jgi:hypothetical protein
MDLKVDALVEGCIILLVDLQKDGGKTDYLTNS